MSSRGVYQFPSDTNQALFVSRVGTLRGDVAGLAGAVRDLGGLLEIEDWAVPALREHLAEFGAYLVPDSWSRG